MTCVSSRITSSSRLEPHLHPVLTIILTLHAETIINNNFVSALPITIIVDNFIKVAQDEQQAEQCKEFIEMEHHREEGDRQQLLRDGLKKGAPY